MDSLIANQHLRWHCLLTLEDETTACETHLATRELETQMTQRVIRGEIDKVGKGQMKKKKDRQKKRKKHTQH